MAVAHAREVRKAKRQEKNPCANADPLAHLLAFDIEAKCTPVLGQGEGERRHVEAQRDERVHFESGLGTLHELRRLDLCCLVVGESPRAGITFARNAAQIQQPQLAKGGATKLPAHK